MHWNSLRYFDMANWHKAESSMIILDRHQTNNSNIKDSSSKLSFSIDFILVKETGITIVLHSWLRPFFELLFLIGIYFFSIHGLSGF